MAIALVGTAGAASVGATGANVTPAWGTGESRTAGNLLICWVALTGTAVAGLSTPAGWTQASDLGGGSISTTAEAAVYYRVATGADAAPTLTGAASNVVTARLAEFSGAAGTLDSSNFVGGVGGGGGITSPRAATNDVADATAGDLVVFAFALLYSASATKVFTDTLNNGVTANVADSASLTTTNHYHFVYGFTTGNAAADSDSLAFTTTKISNMNGVSASFAPGSGAPAARRRQPRVVGQAVQQAAGMRCWARRPRSSILVPRLWTPQGA